MDIVRDQDIIVIGIQPWDIEIGSNCKNIAEEFAKTNRVLYVNPPLDRITRMKERDNPKIKKRLRIARGLEPDLVLLGENLWNLYPAGMIESINRISNTTLYDLLNKRNNRIFASSVKTAVKRLGMKDYILFNDSSMFNGLYMKELLNPKLYVYYMRDYLVKVPYWQRQGERLEPQLICKADLVVNNSVLYAEYGRRFNPHSYMVGQGCDLSMFDEAISPVIPATDLDPIPRPIIGYVGNISALRMDISLLTEIAHKRPEWSIVLVGPEDEAFKSSELHHLNNVYFTGPREVSMLPRYIKGFDVCINPQVINDYTRGNYPRKIDEYLAMGKPVVATATEAMEYFAGYTYLAKSAGEYTILIEQALKEDNFEHQQRRKEFAAQHSWHNNVKEIYRYMMHVLDEKQSE